MKASSSPSLNFVNNIVKLGIEVFILPKVIEVFR